MRLFVTSIAVAMCLSSHAAGQNRPDSIQNAGNIHSSAGHEYGGSNAIIADSAGNLEAYKQGSSTTQQDTERSDWPAIASALSAVAIALLTLAYVLATRKMLREISKQGETSIIQMKVMAEQAEMTRQLWHSTHEQDITLGDQLTEMERLTKETQILAESAKRSADAAIVAMRPWIYVRIESPSTDWFSVKAFNAGKIPAEIWRNEGSFHFAEKDSALDADPNYMSDEYVLAHRPLMIPDGESESVYAIPVSTIRENAPEQMRKIGTFEQKLYIWGRISYGIPGEKRIMWETRWCFVYIPFNPPNMVVGGPPGYNDRT